MPTLVEELAKQVVTNNAVLFFGAGVSKLAGLPLWDELLDLCIQKAAEDPDAAVRNTAEWIREYKRTRDMLLVAELMQRKLSQPKLSQFIEESLAPYSGVQPSATHRALASIRWSQVLTTNYDSLFDGCFAHKGASLSWKDSLFYLDALKRGICTIFKLHGAISEPKSLILTRSEFSVIQYDAPLLSSCISSLLLTKTFVFVGYSLRDPDLLHLIEQVKKVALDGFGPHYIFLPKVECAPEYCAFLKEKYGITVITVDHSDDPAERWKSYERNLIETFRALEGEVLAMGAADPFPVSELTLMNLKSSTAKILESVVRATGSIRGDVCLEQRESNSQLIRVASYPGPLANPEERAAPYPGARTNPEEIDSDQVIGTVFLNRRETEDYIYLPDIGKADEKLKSMGYTMAKYRNVDLRVNSELAVPIYSGGRRVGVLNLESAEPNRYSDGHIRHVQAIANHIGWVKEEVTRRINTANAFEGYFKEDGILEFTQQLAKRRAIQFAELQCALYQLDYTNGVLIVHSNNEPPLTQEVKKLRHQFEGTSLAAKVLKSGSITIEPDAREAGRAGRLDLAGVNHLNIDGPIAGYPIRLNGTIISVLVTWSTNKKNLTEETRFKKFRVASDRAYRICRLLTENGEQQKAYQLLREMDIVAGGFSGEEVESSLALQRSGNWKRFASSYLDLLLNRSVGFKRVRLWVCAKGPDGQSSRRRFCIDYSRSTEDSTVPGKSPTNEYVGCTSSDASKYTRLTIDRAMNDPYSRRQHKSVFGEFDPNYLQLDKNPDAEWAVAPLVKGRVLWGFVSADVDVWDPKKDSMGAGESVSQLQHFALDVITHTLSSFQPAHLNDLWSA